MDIKAKGILLDSSQWADLAAVKQNSPVWGRLWKRLNSKKYIMADSAVLADKVRYRGDSLMFLMKSSTINVIM
jgi:hypothetical protein